MSELLSKTLNCTEDVRLDPRELPCKDMDLDCLAFDGIIPFGDYRRCYQYAAEQGKCPFCPTCDEDLA